MIKVGIIGYGYMGQIRHKVADAHPDLEVVMICDPREGAIPESSRYEVVHDCAKVLESAAELIFVCTPNNLIPEIVCEGLKRGKHVFAEKPPGRNFEDVNMMRAAEAKNPKQKLMFGFNHRYHPGILRAKDLISRGRLGKILWLRGIYGKSGGVNFKQSWRNDKNISGGGILLDQGIHMLDLFNYFCGPFEEVKSFMSNSFWKFDIEDNAFVIMQNKNGQNAMLHSSATLWKHKFKIEIGLEKGYLIVQGLLSKSGSYGRETLIVGRQQFEDEAFAVGNPSEEITYFDKDLSWDIEVDKLVQCVKNDVPVEESSSLDAYNAMRIVHLAYENNKSEV